MEIDAVNVSICLPVRSSTMNSLNVIMITIPIRIPLQFILQFILSYTQKFISSVTYQSTSSIFSRMSLAVGFICWIEGTIHLTKAYFRFFDCWYKIEKSHKLQPHLQSFDDITMLQSTRMGWESMRTKFIKKRFKDFFLLSVHLYFQPSSIIALIEEMPF